MNKPTAGCLTKVMSFLPETGSRFRIHETFSREEERNISLLIEERLPGGEGIFVRYPTAIHSHFRRGVHSCGVKVLMFHRGDHRLHERLTLLGRFLTNDSSYAWHCFLEIRIRGQKSEVRSQKSEVRGQRSEIEEPRLER